MLEPGRVIAFYDRHPISEEQILDTLRGQGKDLRRLTSDDLHPLDQDHYGGLAAVEALARRAAIGVGSRVLDVCAGLGGPARFLAARFGACVVAVDLHPGRSAADLRLTRRVGLEGRVRPVRADAQRLPFRDRSFTAVVSQEGLLHVPDKAAVIRECARVLLPGGRLAFSDWIATGRLGDGERRALADWMAADGIQTIAGYLGILGRSGFAALAVEDLSAAWTVILRERQRIYRVLRAATVARLGERTYDEYQQLYAFFVGLVEAGKLGGARFSGTSDPGTA
ncbi:MAG: methyltransferase domain-containing protein [Candidatus Rokubacteria bacterium]|nr:methyltransferase domain-containing protein [Candidatus Rokubacteria bacterium]